MAENTSLWREGADIPRRARLDGDRRCDALVIGAGMAGVLITRALKARGLSVITLEAARIGSGQTKNTTAKITSQHGMIYDALTQKFGVEQADMYARANEAAIDEYERLIRDKNIDCDFRRAPSYIYSTAAADPMLREADAAKRVGIDAAFVTRAELPFDIAGGVRFERQAMFHPLKFLRAVSEDIEIYEDSRVLTVEDDRAVTQSGVVRFDSVVFATHYPFVNVPGWYFLRMHQERSYVLALKSGWLPEGMYRGTDADGLSFRSAEGRLLLGGESHRTGENSAGGHYARLEARAREMLGDVEITARRSAQDCVTLDGLPYIGTYSPAKPNWYVATGFAKWGMTLSMVSALTVGGMICGGAPTWSGVFSPSRFKLSASARSLATETAQACKGLARGIAALPKETLDELPVGHGGIVEALGRKIGVYKDQSGRCHAVNPRCPHMGCQVEWNPDEWSWDCPCHGSRFDMDGALIDNPAQEGLT